jgi:hypothetical protein
VKSRGSCAGQQPTHLPRAPRPPPPLPLPKVAYGIQRVEGALPALLRLAQGGTAVGTGLNTKKGYDVAVAKQVGRGGVCGCEGGAEQVWQTPLHG